MHEMSVMEDIINIINVSAKEKKFTRVRKICLEVGDLVCVEPSALEFCFSVISKGTIAEDAMLKIIRVPGTGICLNCNKTIKYERLYDPCIYCNNYNIKKISGDELRVKDLLVV